MTEQSGRGPERLRLGRKQPVLQAKEGANEPAGTGAQNNEVKQSIIQSLK